MKKGVIKPIESGDERVGSKSYQIEYEVFPLRAIYQVDIEANSEDEALKSFWKSKPRGEVRSIDGAKKFPYLKNPSL